MTISKDIRFKALKSHLAKGKNIDDEKLRQWLVLNTNPQRGVLVTQEDLLETFISYDSLDSCYAIYNDVYSILQVELNKLGASNNYLKQKIRFYEKLVSKDEICFLQPILRWHTTKSDHTRSSKEIAKTIAITQKPIKLGGLHELCKLCNLSQSHYDKMRYFAKVNNINTKKCGIIYNYYTKEYNVVFLEYGL